MRFGSRNGQAIILVVVAASLILIGALGFAIDGGQVYAQRQMAQAAADAAAEAGIMSILRGTNATSTYTFGTGATPIASYTCTTSDGRTPCVYARDNGFGSSSDDTVTLSYPSSVSGVTLSSGNVPAFEVTVQRNIHTGFIQFIGGPATTTITAKSYAGVTGTGSTTCVYLLASSGSKQLNVSGGSSVTMSGCGIAMDSSDSDAMDVSGGSTVSASAIAVVGGVNNHGCPTCITPNPPTTGVAAVVDPFASLPALPVGSCATHPTAFTAVSGTPIQPGTYCGGINIGSGTFSFVSGQYIINGGGLTINGGTVTGSGVIFYLTGTNSSYRSVTTNGNSTNVTLSGPTSGTYEGIVFDQDRSLTINNQDAKFQGGGSVAIDGTLYFPGTGIQFSGGTGDSGYSAFVTQALTFSGGSSTIQYDATGTKTGLSSKSVAMVQ